MVSNLNINVPCVVKRREDKGSKAIDQKIDMLHIITLQVDVLIVGVVLRLQEGTQPRDEGW